jgi:hypothetical protein
VFNDFINILGFKELNNKLVDGFQISVELAKENFLERLRRERCENQSKKNDYNVQKNETYSNNNSFNNIHITSKSKDQTFHDANLSLNDHQVKKNKKGLQNNQENEDQNDESRQKNLRIAKHDYDNSKTQKFPKEKYSNNLELKKTNNYEKNKQNISNNLTEANNNNKSKTNISEDLIINESEKKRLMSLQQKKQTFKKQKQTIHDCLKLVVSKMYNFFTNIK